MWSSSLGPLFSLIPMNTEASGSLHIVLTHMPETNVLWDRESHQIWFLEAKLFTIV